MISCNCLSRNVLMSFFCLGMLITNDVIQISFVVDILLNVVVAFLF